MSGGVQDLRDYADQLERDDQLQVPGGLAEDLRWAADEIERLRKALEAIAEHQETVGGNLSSLSATRRIALNVLADSQVDR